VQIVALFKNQSSECVPNPKRWFPSDVLKLVDGACGGDIVINYYYRAEVGYSNTGLASEKHSLPS